MDQVNLVFEICSENEPVANPTNRGAVADSKFTFPLTLRSATLGAAAMSETTRRLRAVAVTVLTTQT